MIAEKEEDNTFQMTEDARFINNIILPNNVRFTGFAALHDKTKILQTGDHNIKKGDKVIVEYKAYDV